MTVFCAIPAVNWLNEHRGLSLRRLLALGALLGNVPLIVVIFVIVAAQLARGALSADVGRYWEGLGGVAARAAMGTIVGAGSAFFLWLVAIEDNDSWDTRIAGHRPVARPPGRSGAL